MDTTPTQALSFDDWFREVDTLCQRHLLCTWHDLCGDAGASASGHSGTPEEVFGHGVA